MTRIAFALALLLSSPASAQTENEGDVSALRCAEFTGMDPSLQAEAYEAILNELGTGSASAGGVEGTSGINAADTRAQMEVADQICRENAELLATDAVRRSFQQ